MNIDENGQKFLLTTSHDTTIKGMNLIVSELIRIEGECQIKFDRNESEIDKLFMVNSDHVLCKMSNIK